MSRNILSFLVALLLLGTAPSVALAQAGPASCSTTGKNLYVRDVMSDLYFWYARCRTWTRRRSTRRRRTSRRCATGRSTRPSATSPRAPRTMRSIRRASSSASACRRSLNGVEMRVTQVVPGQPGVRGRPVARRSDRRDRRPLGGGAGRERRDRLRVRADRDRRRDRMSCSIDQAGASRERAHGQAAGDDPDGVADARVQRSSGRRIGYIFFRNFVAAVVRGARQRLRRARGRAASTSSCSTSATTAAGWSTWRSTWRATSAAQRTEGLVFAEYFHNDRNAFRNRILRFETKPAAARARSADRRHHAAVRRRRASS